MNAFERAQRLLELVRPATLLGLTRELDASATGGRLDATAVARQAVLRRVQDALDHGQALNQLILEAVPGGVVVVAASGAVLRANAEAVRILGLRHDRLTQRYVTDFAPDTFHEDGSPCPAEDYPVSRCLATGEPQPPLTIGVRQPSGAIAWAVFTAIPLRDPSGGELLGAAVTFLDVTAQKQTEQALRTSQASFEALVKALPDHVFELDRAGTIRYCNHVPTGYSVDEVLGSCWLEFARSEDRPQVAAALARALEGQATCFVAVATTGRKMRVRLLPLRRGPEAETETVLGVCSEAPDEEAEAEARSLSRRLEEVQRLESVAVLAGGIAHDFNNLLVGILGNIELAQLRSGEGPVSTLLDDARRAARRAGELSEQLLAFSGRPEETFVPQELNELVDEMAHILRAGISKKASLVLELQPGLPGVLGDGTQLRQVVMNLITNASDALGNAPGRIVVRTGLVDGARAAASAVFAAEDLSAGEHVYLEVEDPGCGMTSDVRTRILDPFFTTKGSGRGLGLAGVRGIVRSHRGALAVTSEPGAGSTFRVMLPSLGRRASSQRFARVRFRAAEPDAQTAAPLVLVVDDEPHVRSVASLVLEAAGYRVHGVADGAQALAHVEAHADVALVVLDLVLTDLDGEEVFRRIRAQRPELPVILASGLNVDEQRARLGSPGRVEYLKKPFSIEVLSDLVDKTLE